MFGSDVCWRRTCDWSAADGSVTEVSELWYQERVYAEGEVRQKNMCVYSNYFLLITVLNT